MFRLHSSLVDSRSRDHSGVFFCPKEMLGISPTAVPMQLPVNLEVTTELANYQSQGLFV